MPFGRRNDASTERWDVSQQLKQLGMDVTQMDSSEITQGADKTRPHRLRKWVTGSKFVSGSVGTDLTPCGGRSEG